MKKTLTIAALTLLSASAFASKARLNSLGNAAHLIDVQNLFEKPQQAHEFGDLVTTEWGTTTSTATSPASPHAEGGFLRKSDSAYYGFYLGKRSDDFNSAISGANSLLTTTVTAGLPYEDNGLNFIYARKIGDINYGMNFKYSSNNKKSTVTTATAGQAKSNTMGINLGADGGAWDVELGVGLAGVSSTDVTAGTYQYKSSSNNKLQGGYQMDSMYLYGSYKSKGGALTSPTATLVDVTQTDMTVGVLETMKKDNMNFFYGISYVNTVYKDGGTYANTVALANASGLNNKEETTTTPIIIGLEAEAASWLMLRASVTQDLDLLSSRKRTTVSTTASYNDGADTTADGTAVAAGVGIKFNKFMLDGTLTTSGKLLANQGTDGYAANTSLTYMF